MVLTRLALYPVQRVISTVCAGLRLRKQGRQPSQTSEIAIEVSWKDIQRRGLRPKNSLFVARRPAWMTVTRRGMFSGYSVC